MSESKIHVSKSCPNLQLSSPISEVKTPLSSVDLSVSKPLTQIKQDQVRYYQCLEKHRMIYIVYVHNYKTGATQYGAVIDRLPIQSKNGMKKYKHPTRQESKRRCFQLAHQRFKLYPIHVNISFQIYTHKLKDYIEEQLDQFKSIGPDPYWRLYHRVLESRLRKALIDFGVCVK